MTRYVFTAHINAENVHEAWERLAEFPTSFTPDELKKVTPWLSKFELDEPGVRSLGWDLDALGNSYGD